MRDRTDDDYIALDEAINTLGDWSEEIEAELKARGRSETLLAIVLAAAGRVHSPDELPDLFEDITQESQ